MEKINEFCFLIPHRKHDYDAISRKEIKAPKSIEMQRLEGWEEWDTFKNDRSGSRRRVILSPKTLPEIQCEHVTYRETNRRHAVDPHAAGSN
mmetsp:Transcript_24992/g.57789  ORF Transcript_24992/g.57789 Transcript_24992/m.57789 type:complete len:92 (-) Transcript_24992:1469-1744(-)